MIFSCLPYLCHTVCPKSWPISYSKLLYKMGQDFLKIQYQHRKTYIFSILMHNNLSTSQPGWDAGCYWTAAQPSRGKAPIRSRPGIGPDPPVDTPRLDRYRALSFFGDTGQPRFYSVFWGFLFKSIFVFVSWNYFFFSLCFSCLARNHKNAIITQLL